MTVQRYALGEPYWVIAHHSRFQSHNRMHADGLPQALGFRGAFVVGIATFGNMTRALVDTFGDRWLGHALLDVRFVKPVCEGDRIRVETLPVAGRDAECAYEVCAYNETADGELCARMETTIPAQLPSVDCAASIPPNEWEGPVTQSRTWDNIVEGQAYRSLRHTLSAVDNAHWAQILEDDLELYARGTTPALHPAHVLRQVQLGYNNQFIGDNAVHSASRAVLRNTLHVGDTVDVLTVPLKKWEKKANHWLTIYCAVRREGEVCAEIWHTQIIKLRGANPD